MSYKTGFYEGRLGIGLGSTMGMGDGNPRYSLDINGDIRLTGSIVNGDGQVLSLTPPEFDPAGLDGNNRLMYNNVDNSSASSTVTTIAIGDQALSSLTSGTRNIALGYLALRDTTTGHNNIGIGGWAGLANTGSYNIFMGHQVGYGTGTGSSNVGLGQHAILNLTSGNDNVAIGHDSAYQLTTGSNNVCLGGYAGTKMTSSGQNVFLGNYAGSKLTSGGYHNVGLGYGTCGGGGGTATNIQNNVCIGQSAGGYLTTGYSNVFVGQYAGLNSTTGDHNIAIGREAGRYKTDKSGYIAIGQDALSSNAGGQQCVAIGYQALKGVDNNNHYDNTAIGYQCMSVITTGNCNCGYGYSSLMRITSGTYNCCFGKTSGEHISTAHYNCLFGAFAGRYLTSGGSNVCIGAYTATANTAHVNSMSNSICIGTYAGPKTTESSITCKLMIGAPGGQNGNTYRGTDGAFIYGDFNSTTLTSRYLRINGHLGIGCNPGTGYGLKVLSGDVYVANNFYVGSFQVDDQGGHSHISNIAGGGRLEFHTSSYNKIMVLHGTQNSGHIEFNGNVGIGTTSPGSQLQVYEAGTEQAWKGRGVFGNETCAFVCGVYHNKIQIGGHNGALNAWYDIAINPGGGNVGIGRTDPTYKLDMYNNGSARLARFQTTGDVSIEISSTSPSSDYDDCGIVWHGHNSAPWWHLGVTDNESRLCIGYQSNSSSTGWPDSSEKIYFASDGKVHAAGFTNYSDDRIKNNEKTVTNALDIINKLQTKKYFKSTKMYSKEHNYILNDDGIPIKDESGNDITNEDYNIETGFIAQDVKKIPELAYSVFGEEMKYGKEYEIIYDESGNTIDDGTGRPKSKKVLGNYPKKLGVTYQDIFCYNVSATQELDRKVIALENENAELKAELSAIKQHLGI